MEKQNDKKWLGPVIWLVFGLITSVILYGVYYIDIQKNKKQDINTPIIKENIEEEVPPQMDITYTDLVEGLYPITVYEVNKSTYGGYKWEVVAENGIMFYTNNKPKIGDVVFYMDETTDKVYYINK